MAWSNNSPDVVGFYWCHQYGRTRMVRVWKYDTKPELFTNEDGGTEVNDKELYKNAQWYGPIEPPPINTQQGK